MAKVLLDQNLSTEEELTSVLSLPNFEAWVREMGAKGIPIGIRGDANSCAIAMYLVHKAGDSPSVNGESIDFDGENYVVSGWPNEFVDLFDTHKEVGLEGEIYAPVVLEIVEQIKESGRTTVEVGDKHCPDCGYRDCECCDRCGGNENYCDCFACLQCDDEGLRGDANYLIQEDQDELELDDGPYCESCYKRYVEQANTQRQEREEEATKESTVYTAIVNGTDTAPNPVKLDTTRDIGEQLRKQLDYMNVMDWLLKFDYEDVVGNRNQASNCPLNHYLRDVAGDNPSVHGGTVEFDGSTYQVGLFSLAFVRLVDNAIYSRAVTRAQAQGIANYARQLSELLAPLTTYQANEVIGAIAGLLDYSRADTVEGVTKEMEQAYKERQAMDRADLMVETREQMLQKVTRAMRNLLNDA